MTWVIAAPEYVAAAASDLANIGSSLSSANMAALVPTSGVLAAGGDEVSAMIATLFSSHAQAYQALSQQAALFHSQFVQLMNGGASEYALTEAANASPLLTAGTDALSGASVPLQATTVSPLTGVGVATPGNTGAPAGAPSGNTGTAGKPAPVRLFGTGGPGAVAAAPLTSAAAGRGGGWLYNQGGNAGPVGHGGAGGTGLLFGTGDAGASSAAAVEPQALSPLAGVNATPIPTGALGAGGSFVPDAGIRSGAVGGGYAGNVGTADPGIVEAETQAGVGARGSFAGNTPVGFSAPAASGNGATSGDGGAGARAQLPAEQ